MGAHEKYIAIFKAYCPGRSSGSVAPSFVCSPGEVDGWVGGGINYPHGRHKICRSHQNHRQRPYHSPGSQSRGGESGDESHGDGCRPIIEKRQSIKQ